MFVFCIFLFVYVFFVVFMCTFVFVCVFVFVCACVSVSVHVYVRFLLVLFQHTRVTFCLFVHETNSQRNKSFACGLQVNYESVGSFAFLFGQKGRQLVVLHSCCGLVECSAGDAGACVEALFVAT